MALRTRSFRASAGAVEILDRPGLWAALRDPLDMPHVVSWAVSGKRHHQLRAGVSTRTRMLIGSDDGQIEYVPERDAWLLDAVSELMASAAPPSSILSREAIRTGRYHPAAVAKFGVEEHARLEALVAPRRPSLLLDLAVHCAPLSPVRTATEDQDVIDPVDDNAARLLGLLASSSKMRRDDGLVFWGGAFRHRVERRRRLPLTDMVSRLMDDLRCAPMEGESRQAIAMVEAATLDEAAAVSRAIQSRPAYLIALAFDRLKRAKAAKETDTNKLIRELDKAIKDGESE